MTEFQSPVCVGTFSGRDTGVGPSKVIPIGDPIKVHGGCGIVLPRTAAPFDVAIVRIDQRRRAIKNQIVIPPLLNAPVIPCLNIGRVPGVCYGRADVHQFRIRVDITPELDIRQIATIFGMKQARVAQPPFHAYLPRPSSLSGERESPAPG